MRNKHLVGIDLLKTLAIVAIVIYHVNIKLLPGGFIGVDLFFVISGYLLIHSLVKNQHKSLKQVLFRRFGKIWPIIFIVIFSVIIYLTIFNAPVLQRSHTDGLAGLLFLSNWSLVFNNVGYFDSFLVNPFKHFWYISVLMQSFILITILFKGFIKVNIKKINVFVSLMLIIAISSFLLKQILFSQENISRVYYGTDTRIYEIIVGVLGYFVFPVDKLENRRPSKTLIGIISIVSLSIFIFLLLTVSEVSLWIYRFGFLLFAINSLVMIITFSSVNNIFSKVLKNLRFLFFPGKISYSIYLWHYPIIVLSQTYSELAEPSTLYSVIRIVVFILLAFITNKYIERPIGRYGLIRTVELKSWSIVLKNIAIYPLVFIFILGSVGYAIPYISTAFVDTSRDVKVQDELINSDNKVPKVGNDDSGQINENDNKGDHSDTTNKDEIENKDELEIDKVKNQEIKYKQIVLIGDSTGVNVGGRLIDMFPNTIVDAKVSRQLYQSANIFEKYKKYDSEDTALIIMLGTNGVFTKEDIDGLIDPFPKSKKIFVNTKHGSPWEREVNDLLEEYMDEHKDYSLVDWYSTALEHPEYLASDKTHLMEKGIDAIIELILDKLQS